MLTSGRNPFEVVLIVAALLSGIAGLVTPGGGSRLIQELLPGWEGFWSTCLIVGAGTSAVSLMLRPPMTLLIERVGMIWLSGLFIPFGIAVYIAGDYPASIGAFLIAGYGTACFARVVQITQTLSRLRAQLRDRA